MRFTLPEIRRASLTSMVGIEARRFAKHPLFILGVLAAYGVAVWASTLDTATSGGEVHVEGVLAHPIVPAFFIGLTSLVVAASLTRSTDVAAEAMGTAPGSEARRTLAVAGACVVPLVAGLGWLAELFVIVAVRGTHPNELWFPTVNDGYVWCILLALGPISCLGGGLLGVLVGRWLRFRGAAVVAVVVVVAVDMLGQMPYAYDDDRASFRLWVPWAMFHAGGATEEELNGIPAYSQALLPGNPAWYLVYLLVLCALAVVGAIWHDRGARTPRVRLVAVGLLVAAIGCFLLAALTGISDVVISGPIDQAG